MKLITLVEIQTLQNTNTDFIFVNALLPQIFEKSHIPGSINLPIKQDDFDDLAAKYLPDLNAKIITYCTGPKWKSSHKAAVRLEELGYSDVQEFKGGLFDWAKARLPLIRK